MNQHIRSDKQVDTCSVLRSCKLKVDDTTAANGSSDALFITGKTIPRQRNRELGPTRSIANGSSDNYYDDENDEATDTPANQTNNGSKGTMKIKPFIFWRVQYNDLPPVPSDGSLERTSLKFKENSLRTLTNQISDYMAFNTILCIHSTTPAGKIHCYYGEATAASIAAAIDAIRDPVNSGNNTGFGTSHVGASIHNARINTENSCEILKFVVQLWQSNGDGGDDCCVIMEVQRRRGCCIVMRRIRHHLYRFLARNGCHYSFVSCADDNNTQWGSNSSPDLTSNSDVCFFSKKSLERTLSVPSSIKELAKKEDRMANTRSLLNNPLHLRRNHYESSSCERTKR